MRFANREHAGRLLSSSLSKYKDDAPVVLGLPRGGVRVAFEVARELQAPLDVAIVRKVGAPEVPELGMGAVAEGGIVYLDRRIIHVVGATPAEVDERVHEKYAEVVERVRRFRRGHPRVDLQGRVVIIVDDGIATGGTVHAAVQALRTLGPSKIVVAVPVGAPDAVEALRALVDEVVCLEAPPNMYAIGSWYEDFAQVTDDEVAALLERARLGWKPVEPPARVQALSPTRDRERREDVAIDTLDCTLRGTLRVPTGARGLVIFVHGSGSGRFSPRNLHVAAELGQRGFATLLFDLLTPEEESIDQVSAELRFDIERLARRLVEVTAWARAEPLTRALRIGYFGASTGAAAALVAAAEQPGSVHAVVSRGGRPDLASHRLSTVRVPALLIVGGADREVIGLNRRAYSELLAPKRLIIVPRATHLFEEPGALDAVAKHAGDWFDRYLVPATEERGVHPPA